MSGSSLKLVLCGYDEKDARFIADCCSAAVGAPVELIGASFADKLTVAQATEPGFKQSFGSRPVKLFLMTGFGRSEITAAYDGFPRDMEQPIFCMETEENISWTFEYLLEHLLEEKRRLEGNV